MTAYPHLLSLCEASEGAAATVAELTDELNEQRAVLAELPARDRRRVLVERAIAQLSRRLASASSTATDAVARYTAALDALPGQLDPSVPCALLPVRLETRIRSRTDGLAGDELVCRVYPDDIHLDGHDPTLTLDEAEFGRGYWQQHWDAEGASDATERRQRAWHQLALRVTPTRAAWVARVMAPVNAPPPPGTALDFPRPELRGADGRPTVAAGLPDRFMVRLWRDGALLGEARGGLIRRPLAAGPAVGPDDPPGPAGWTTDLPQALAAGMAVVVRPDPPVALDRVDIVTCLGVRGSDTALESAAELRNLFDSHQFAPRLVGPGLDLVPPGTPTNNTPAARSRHRRDSTGERSADRVLGPPVARRGDGSDADVLAAALALPDRDAQGLDPEELFVLGRLDSAATPGQRDAAAMATMLWPATWGYYLRQLLPSMPGLDPGADLSAWRRFVVDTVRGRGPLPTLQIGDQPYGVLPVLAASAWRHWPDRPELIVATHAPGRRPDAVTRVCWDLDASGIASAWTVAGDIPLDPDTSGLDIAAGDVDGGPVLVALTSRATTGELEHRWSRLDAHGTAASWTDARPVTPDGTPLSAGRAGVALAAFDGRPALVVAAQQRSGPPRPSGRPLTTVCVGSDPSADGEVALWSTAVQVPGTDPGVLAALVAGDLAGTGAVDLVVAYLRRGTTTDEVRFRVGVGLRPDGGADHWTGPFDVPVPGGWTVAAAGVALARLGGRSSVDLVVRLVGDASGQAIDHYAIGHGLSDAGVADGWLGWFGTGAEGPEADVVSAPVAVASVGVARRVGLADQSGMLALLDRARSDWAAATTGVPRIGRAADPTDDLLDLFASDAVSGSVWARGLIGPVVLANTWMAAGRTDVDLDLYRDLLWQATRSLPVGWGLLDDGDPVDPAARSRLGRSGFEVVATELAGTLAADGDALRRAAKYEPADLEAWPPDSSAALLDRLARHATAQAWADAGLALWPPDSPPDKEPIVEPELIDLNAVDVVDAVVNPFTWTAWRHLRTRTFPPGHQWQGRKVEDGVAELLAVAEQGGDLSAYGPAGQRVHELAELRAALGHLAERPGDALAWTLGETLDLASHRLDAWFTAVATHRLREMRTRQPAGLHLGAYGIVTDLRKRTGPVTEGYVHAPSAGQATTAAVLHSAHLTHADVGALSIDLTSRRVRDAVELADGVRAGQPLGALLGYRLERALLADPSLGLGRYLPALRQVAPQSVGKLTALSTGVSVDAVGAPDVVDGLALVRASEQDAITPIPWGQTPPGADIALPAAASADGTSIARAIAEQRDSLDALGDLLLAESVHHTVNGNPSGGGGALDVLSGGEVPPPQPDVVRTPRTGTGVTHRLLLALSQTATAGSAGWPGSDTRPRAMAQPQLDAWAATALGDAGRVRWQAIWLDADGAELGRGEYTLAALGLCPLDVVHLGTDAVVGDAPEDGGPGSDPASRTDIERVLACHATAHPPAGAGSGELRLDLTRATGWTDDVLSVPEVLDVAAAVRDLVTAARPANAADVSGPRGLRPDAGLELTHLVTAAADAIGGLETAVAALREPFAASDPTALRAALVDAFPTTPADRFDAVENLLDVPTHLDVSSAVGAAGLPTAGDAGIVRSSLLELSGYGVPQSAPITPSGEAAADLAALAGQARQVAGDAARRVAAAQTAADPIAALAAVFGPGFVVVPPVLLPAGGEPAEPGGELAGGVLQVAADEVATWLEGVALVRAGAARLADLRLVGDAAGTGSATSLRVVQLPAGHDDWLGSSITGAPPGGVVSMVFAGPAFDPDKPLAVLLVDEWVEVIPAASQDTGLVFHVDTPSACAPQSVLLAVPGDPARRWDVDALEQVVLDTVRLAQLRAVDPDIAGAPATGHYLPALLFARNDEGATVSTDFPRVPPA